MPNTKNEPETVHSQTGGPSGRGKGSNRGSEQRAEGEDAPSRDMQSGEGEVDENEQPIRAPGGDGRASVRTDGRNDGKPDAPMPNPDGSRK